MPAFKHIVVVGCNGRFGRAFAARLAPAAERITGVDIGAAAEAGGLAGDYLRGSLEAPDAAFGALVAEADCLVLCVPEPAVLAGLPFLLEHASPEACIADIASVKTRIAQRVAELGGATGYVGLHPMFAPSEQFEGRNLAVVRIRENAATSALEALVGRWGTRLSIHSAEEHDRLAAAVQVVPHAALLAYGAALRASGVEAQNAALLATPVQEALLSLLARVLRGPDETYWSIQTDNPFAAETRAGLARALGELDSIAASGDTAEFGRWLDRIRDHLGTEFDALALRSQRIVEAARREAASEDADDV